MQTAPSSWAARPTHFFRVGARTGNTLTGLRPKAQSPSPTKGVPTGANAKHLLRRARDSGQFGLCLISELRPDWPFLQEVRHTIWSTVGARTGTTLTGLRPKAQSPSPTEGEPAGANAKHSLRPDLDF